MTQQNWLARARAIKKRRRERLLAAAHQKVEKQRERKPPRQPQLELDDVYVSKREHDLVVMRQAREREQRIEAAHVRATPPPGEFPRWQQLELATGED